MSSWVDVLILGGLFTSIVNFVPAVCELWQTPYSQANVATILKKYIALMSESESVGICVGLLIVSVAKYPPWSSTSQTIESSNGVLGSIGMYAVPTCVYIVVAIALSIFEPKILFTVQIHHF